MTAPCKKVNVLCIKSSQYYEPLYKQKPQCLALGFFINTKNYLTKFVVKTKRRTDRAIR